MRDTNTNTFSNKVNTSKLEVGMVISYIDLCNAIGEKPCGGADCKKQTYNWRRYFNYVYKNGKYNITHIYDEPFDVELEDWRKDYFIGGGKYLLLSLLDKESNKPYIIRTRLQLSKELGLADNSQNENDIGTDEISETSDSAFSNSFQFFNAILRDLRKNYLISWDKVYMIKRSENAPYTEERIEVTEQDGETYYNNVDSLRITEAETDILRKFYNEGKIREIDMTEIGRVRLFTEFHRQVNALLKEKYGWESCYKAYKIKAIKTDINAWNKSKELYKSKIDEYQKKVIDYVFEKEEKKHGIKFDARFSQGASFDNFAKLTFEAWHIANKLLLNPEMTNIEIQDCVNKIYLK